eukprot:TRINITY_DN16503_c0_g1_i1.p1 TRINITY_DN16503_c0_g1~~TRINITY_DN16503_c0_g1_i1.p1  ORF type:complete len:300 (+),score=70.39 TRINITY_DN16503_c0_g1_i1:60-959(+)
MDLWQRARGFAEEAAKKSQELTKEAAKRSQELTKISQDFVSETAKKSKEFAVEATKKADQIKIEALKRADQIKSLAEGISPQIPSSVAAILPSDSPAAESPDLEKFGVTDDLREFVKGITISTFQDFPMEDEPQVLDIPTVSNVRQDLTEWQAKHATIVLSTVKEISRLRYELCPRHMKERKFWRIYFILVNSHVVQYEKLYMEELKLKSAKQEKDDRGNENPIVGKASKPEIPETKLQSKTSTSSFTEQDLDTFLLGDLGSSDEGPDDDDGVLDDDDFDKIVSHSALESEEEDERKTK